MNRKCCRKLDDVIAFPASGAHVGEIFRGMRFVVVLVFASVWIGILLLVEVAECVVYFSVLAFVGANYRMLAYMSTKK